MSKPVQSYRELRVYQVAFDTAMEIFELTKIFPKEEKYSLTDQIRRSSRSVCQSIAEAWKKRPYPAHFVSKLTDSDSEASETEVWLDFAYKCGYLSAEDHEKFLDRYDHIGRMLTNMINDPDGWCKNVRRK